jgi:mono/diheme cytochrome c family protein
MMLQREFLAAALVTLLGQFAAVVAAEPIDYVKQIEPILQAHCAKCHGEAKAMAKLRLDTAAGVQEKLAADPELIVAGKPEESELYERLVLPADNAKRMPKGADPLPESDVKLIAEWIKQGATFAVAAAAAPAPAALAPAALAPAAAPAAAEPAAKPAEKLPLPEVAAAPQASIDKLTAAGARVMPLFAGSNLLDVSFAPRSEPTGDAEVALLAEVADQVYSLNLAKAKVSADGLAPLEKLKNLSQLHLELAQIDDAAIPHLGKLERLEYLNLYGTPITDANIKQLAALKHLGRLYLWQTKVSYDAAMSLEKDIPGLVVNLGFDHPVVARNRLTKELETAKKQLEVVKADQAKFEAELERSKKEVETNTARVADIEKQLGEIEKPKDGA